MVLGDFKAAAEDLDRGIKSSIPHQPIFWQARRMKGECHLRLNEFAEAIKELKQVTTRPFSSNDPNFEWQKAAFSNFGKALLEAGEYTESVKAFDKAISIFHDPRFAGQDAEALLLRGIARQKAGETGFASDWKEAAGMGSERAAHLLQSLS
jgi:tetratricopeptide (TPR) repeat protein